jgi:hypothetical protein
MTENMVFQQPVNLAVAIHIKKTSASWLGAFYIAFCPNP